MTEYLVDLASYQHGINLSAVRAAGFSRVNIKLTEGTGYVNPYIAEFVDGARLRQMDICTFHWLNGSSSGAAQAKAALAQMDRFGLRYGTAHQVDCEDTSHPATWAIWRDYVNAMQDALGRHVINYTGDWWWAAHAQGWNGPSLTPYLWAAPDHGYDAAYPGDSSPDWQADFGGWGAFSAVQFAVAPIPGAGGGNLSLTAFRDPHVWTALTGVDAATTEGDDMTPADMLGAMLSGESIGNDESVGDALKDILVAARKVDGIEAAVKALSTLTLAVTQDQINAAVAANVPALAAALAEHFKVQ